MSTTNMALAALDLLARVKATNAAAFGGLHALAADDAGGRARLPAFPFARGHDEFVVDGVQQSFVPPAPEVFLHRRKRREILRQEPPRAARRGHVKQRVHHFAQVRLAGAADAVRLRQQRRDQRLRPSGRLRSAGSAVHSEGEWFRSRPLSSPSNLSNPTESQPAEITHFFLEQTLRRKMSKTLSLYLLDVSLD